MRFLRACCAACVLLALAFGLVVVIGGYPDIVAPPPRCLAPRGKARRKKGDSGGGRTRPPIQNHIGKLVGRFKDVEGE